MGVEGPQRARGWTQMWVPPRTVEVSVFFDPKGGNHVEGSC